MSVRIVSAVCKLVFPWILIGSQVVSTNSFSISIFLELQEDYCHTCFRVGSTCILSNRTEFDKRAPWTAFNFFWLSNGSGTNYFKQITSCFK